MSEILANELRVDEDVLKWATDEEIMVLRRIGETVAMRIREGESKQPCLFKNDCFNLI